MGGYTFNQWLLTTSNVSFNNVTAAQEVTAWASDERLKIKLGNIENALATVNKLNPFKFVFNQYAKDAGVGDNRTHYGLSAQEVENLLPEITRPAPFDTDKEGNSKSGNNYLTLDYSKLVPLLLEAVKELSYKISELEKKCQ